MKFRFSLTEFLLASIGTVLFIAVSFVKIPGLFEELDVINVGIIILAFFAITYGPVVGGLVGIMGYSLMRLLTSDTFHWSVALSYAVFAILIGLLVDKYKVREGGFGVRQIVIFQITQITVNMLTWVMIASLLDVLFYANEAVTLIKYGFIAFTSNTILTGIFTTILGWVYSSFIIIKKKNVKLQN